MRQISSPELRYVFLCFSFRHCDPVSVELNISSVAWDKDYFGLTGLL